MYDPAAPPTKKKQWWHAEKMPDSDPSQKITTLSLHSESIDD